MHFKRASYIIAVAALVAACAAKDPDPVTFGDFQAWMKSAPRTVQLRVTRPTQSHVRVYWLESNAARDAASGAGKGALAGARGALSGQGEEFLLGLLLLPVFTVGGAVVGGTYGAATSDPSPHAYTIDEIRDAEEQFLDVAMGDEQLRSIETATARTLTRIGRHKVSVMNEGEGEDDLKPGQADVLLRVHGFDFEGRHPDDQNLAMSVRMSIAVDWNAHGKSHYAYSRVKTTSDRYPADRWVTDETLLRQELANAYSTLANNAAYHMHDRY